MCKPILIALALIALAVSVPAAPLEIGDPAPALSVSQWLIGPAVTPAASDGKTITVIEFWATWCPPCRESIPHLSELQKKYKDKGVVIAGISNEPEATVRPFMTEMKMDYRVALDDENKTMDRWLDGVPGIPHAFVVGKDGRILWSGHPMAGLDGVLAEVIAGTYNPNAAKKQAELLRQLEETEDPDAQLKIVEQLLQLDPKNDSFHEMKIDLLQYKGDTAGVKAAREAAAKAMGDSPADLNRMAWTLATAEDISERDLSMAYDLATRAVKASRNAAYLDTLARVCYAAGALDKAISIEKEALAVAGAAEYKDAIQNALTYYQNAAKLRDRITAEK